MFDLKTQVDQQGSTSTERTNTWYFFLQIFLCFRQCIEQLVQFIQAWGRFFVLKNDVRFDREKKSEEATYRLDNRIRTNQIQCLISLRRQSVIEHHRFQPSFVLIASLVGMSSTLANILKISEQLIWSTKEWMRNRFRLVSYSHLPRSSIVQTVWLSNIQMIERKINNVTNAIRLD